MQEKDITTVCTRTAKAAGETNRSAYARESPEARSAITRVEGKVDLLLKHAGLEYDPYADVSDEVTDALDSGNKTLAIKWYRHATGSDLAEAKTSIEEVERRRNSGS